MSPHARHFAGAGRALHSEMPMMAETDFLGKSMAWSVTWIPIVSVPIARQKSGCCVTGQSP